MESNENAKILMFSEADGCQIKIFQGPDVLKSEIDFSMALDQHAVYSKEFDKTMESKVAVINNQKCFAVYFDDGSIYEFGTGKCRDDKFCDKEWAIWLWHRLQNKRYKRKTKKLLK